MRSSLTMADVAAAAGVTKMTVSLALRNHPSLPRATCRQIQELAISMGYRPNPLVSALMTELRSRKKGVSPVTIAYVTIDRLDYSLTMDKFFRGAKGRAESLGYQLEKFSLEEKGMNLNRLAKILWNRNIRGLIFAPVAAPRSGEMLDWPDFSMVALGFSISGLKVHRVANHQRRTMTIALEELYRRGYRRIGAAVEPTANPRVEYAWFAGYDVFLRTHPDCPRLPEPETNTEQALTRWYKKHQPDGIATLFPNMVDIVRKAGKRVPEDVGIAHLGLHPETNPMSGTDQHGEIIGATATDMVVEEMYHNHLGVAVYPKTLFIESDWVDGNSTRPLPRRG